MGAAIAGAAGSLFTYLAFTKTEDITFGGVAKAALTGAVVGALGLVSESYRLIAAGAAALISGISAATSTEGSIPQKITVGVETGLLTGLSVYAGSSNGEFYKGLNEPLTEFAAEYSLGLINGVSFGLGSYFLSKFSMKFVDRIETKIRFNRMHREIEAQLQGVTSL